MAQVISNSLLRHNLQYAEKFSAKLPEEVANALKLGVASDISVHFQKNIPSKEVLDILQDLVKTFKPDSSDITQNQRPGNASSGPTFAERDTAFLSELGKEIAAQRSMLTINTLDLALPSPEMHEVKSDAPSHVITSSSSSSKGKVSFTTDKGAIKPDLNGNDIQWAMAAIQTVPDLKNLLDKALSTGNLTIVVGKAHTSYDPGTHTIYLQESKMKSKMDCLHHLVFELSNACYRDQYQKIETLARQGELDFISYALLKETIEFETEILHDRTLLNIKPGRTEKKEWKWPVVDISEHILNRDGKNRAQQLEFNVKDGHTGGYLIQWMKDYANAYLSKHPEQKPIIEAFLTASQWADTPKLVQIKTLESFGLDIKDKEISLVSWGLFQTFTAHIPNKDKKELLTACK